MKFFAIRRRSDGAFLPAINGQRGYTGKAEPSKTLPPRLFRLRGHAAAALDCWAKGAWYMSRTGGYNAYAGDSDYDEEFLVDKVEGRDVADFEIVEVRVSVIKGGSDRVREG